MPVSRRQSGDDLVLREAQILELVHQHRVPPRANLGRGAGLQAQQVAGEGDEIVVIQQAARAQSLAVGVEVLLVARGELVMLELAPAEEAQQLRLPLGPDAEPPQHPLLILFVGETEPAPQAHQLRVLPEQRETERVQRAAVHVVRGRADLAPQPRGDLVGRLVGEGDRADALRIEAPAC